MNFFSTVNRTIHPIKGKSFKMVAGQKITPTQVKILDSMNRSSFYETIIPGKRAPFVSYNTDQRYFIAEAYNAGFNRSEIVEGFLEEFGTDHPVSSIGEKVEICKATDNQLINNTKFVCNDKELISILESMNPVRFGSNIENKIDSILVEIRS